MDFIELAKTKIKLYSRSEGKNITLSSIKLVYYTKTLEHKKAFFYSTHTKEFIEVVKNGYLSEMYINIYEKKHHIKLKI